MINQKIKQHIIVPIFLAVTLAGCVTKPGDIDNSSIEQVVSENEKADDIRENVDEQVSSNKDKEDAESEIEEQEIQNENKKPASDKAHDHQWLPIYRTETKVIREGDIEYIRDFYFDITCECGEKFRDFESWQAHSDQKKALAENGTIAEDEVCLDNTFVTVNPIVDTIVHEPEVEETEVLDHYQCSICGVTKN